MIAINALILMTKNSDICRHTSLMELMPLMPLMPLMTINGLPPRH